MLGFTFKGIHSSEFNIGFRSVNRTLLPQRRKKEFLIPGKSGTYELPSSEYDKRTITGVIGIMEIYKFNNLREKVRELAEWLSGTDYLVFDDEPDKMYMASVYSAIGLTQLQLQPRATAEISFNCQPFALSLELYKKNVDVPKNKEFEITSNGNVNTCGTIRIKNTSSGFIHNIVIVRKGVKK